MRGRLSSESITTTPTKRQRFQVNNTRRGHFHFELQGNTRSTFEDGEMNKRTIRSRGCPTAAIAILGIILTVGMMIRFVSMTTHLSDARHLGRVVLSSKTTHDTTYPKQPTKPTFWEEKRGLVIFYHVPKTAGTFVRETLQAHHIAVERVFSTKQLHGRKYGERIRQLLHDESYELLVLELHGTFVGIPDLPIRQWRETAMDHHVPLFAFTLLRDPVAFHDSYFSFFHRPGCYHRWCEPILYENMTEESLLESLVPNKQCEILYHGQLELKWNVSLHDRRVSETECNHVQNVLQTDWDWVGTTETVAQSTIPMLLRLLLSNESLSGLTIQPQPFVRRHKIISTEQTETIIRNRSWLDQRLYAHSSSSMLMS